MIIRLYKRQAKESNSTKIMTFLPSHMADFSILHLIIQVETLSCGEKCLQGVSVFAQKIKSKIKFKECNSCKISYLHMWLNLQYYIWMYKWRNSQMEMMLAKVPFFATKINQGSNQLHNCSFTLATKDGISPFINFNEKNMLRVCASRSFWVECGKVSLVCWQVAGYKIPHLRKTKKENKILDNIPLKH